MSKAKLMKRADTLPVNSNNGAKHLSGAGVTPRRALAEAISSPRVDRDGNPVPPLRLQSLTKNLVEM